MKTRIASLSCVAWLLLVAASFNAAQAATEDSYVGAIDWSRFTPAENPADTDAIKSRLNSWLNGSNIEENGSLVNANIIHDDYMATFQFNLRSYLAFSLADRTIPQSAAFNLAIMYDALVDLNFSAPPYQSPGGTMYMDGSATPYYPQGTQWSTYRFDIFYCVDAFTRLLGLDTLASTGGLTWERLRATRLQNMQARHSDGHLYAAGEWDAYSGKEQLAAQQFADVYLLKWLISQGELSTVTSWKFPTPTRVDSEDASISYTGSHDDYTGSLWYNNAISLVGTTNGYAQFTFSGPSVKWIGMKQFNLGIANVYLDGVLAQAGIDTYTPGAVNGVELFNRTGLESRSHTIKVVVTANKNAQSTGARIPVDYFEYLAHDSGKWEPEIAAFEQKDRTNPPPQGALLFIGSSTITLWSTLAQDFPEQPVINRGFGGSQIVDSTYFAERIIFPYYPQMVLLRAGANDLAAGKTPQQVFADFQEFEAKVHSNLPEAEIVFISLSPTIARWNQADEEKEVNTMIEQFIRFKPGLQYIETYDIPLGPNGQPRPELFLADGLHFNAAGYQLLAERVRPYLSPPAIRVDGNNASVTYSGVYDDYAGSQWHNNTMRLIAAANGYAQFTFAGTSIKWIGMKQFNLGIADVYLDGVRIQAAIDAYTPGTINGVELFSRTGLADTLHTIRIVETGAKNPSSTGLRIPVDYFECVSESGVVANNDTYGTLEDSALIVAAPGVIGNDTDAEGDPLSAVLVSSPGHGTLALNSNGSFTYTPTANYSGPDNFSYKASDGDIDSNVANVDFTITSVNDSPTLNLLSDLTINEGAGLQTVNLSGITAGGGESQVLTVSASSSNPGLIPNPSVSYASPNTTGSIGFSPVPNANGTATISVQVTDAGGTATGGIDTITRTFLVTVIPVGTSPTSATFLGKDTTTQGNWRGFYGADGYNVINFKVNYPSYATATPSGQADHTWASSTSDVRALSKPAATTDRIASCWYAYKTFTVNLNLTDGLTHRVALYCLDWDTTARSQTIEILDASNNAVLNSQSVTAFNGGQYLVWNIRGHVLIRLTKTGSLNAVLSGIFFDPTPAPAFALSKSAVTSSSDLSPQIHSVRLSNGQFEGTLEGDPNQNYLIQASTDLINWVTISNSLPGRGLIDSEAGNFKQRFYRLIPSGNAPQENDDVDVK